MCWETPSIVTAAMIQGQVMCLRFVGRLWIYVWVAFASGSDASCFISESASSVLVGSVMKEYMTEVIDKILKTDQKILF